MQKQTQIGQREQKRLEVEASDVFAFGNIREPVATAFSAILSSPHPRLLPTT